MTNEDLTTVSRETRKRESGGCRVQRWIIFINEQKSYIEEHHLCPPKHITLRNQVVYFRRKMRDGLLDAEKAKELEKVHGMRYLTIHTGERLKSTIDKR